MQYLLLLRLLDSVFMFLDYVLFLIRSHFVQTFLFFWILYRYINGNMGSLRFIFFCFASASFTQMIGSQSLRKAKAFRGFDLESHTSCTYGFRNQFRFEIEQYHLTSAEKRTILTAVDERRTVLRSFV